MGCRAAGGPRRNGVPAVGVRDVLERRGGAAAWPGAFGYSLEKRIAPRVEVRVRLALAPRGLGGARRSHNVLARRWEDTAQFLTYLESERLAATGLRPQMMRDLRKRVLQRDLCRGWSGWTGFVLERKEQLASLRRGTARMLNRGLALGMTTWRGVVEELARSKTALKRGLSRLLNRELSRGFSAWREMAVGRASFLRKLRKGLGFIVNRQLALGWASWKDGVAELKEFHRGPFQIW